MNAFFPLLFFCFVIFHTNSLPSSLLLPLGLFVHYKGATNVVGLLPGFRNRFSGFWKQLTLGGDEVLANTVTGASYRSAPVLVLSLHVEHQLFSAKNLMWTSFTVSVRNK